MNLKLFRSLANLINVVDIIIGECKANYGTFILLNDQLKM
jgi:hypothetical protein